MTYIEECDTFTNLFYIKDYIQDLNHGIINFMEANNVRFDYVCIYVYKDNDNYVFVTTKLDAKQDNGYRLIWYNKKVGDNSMRILDFRKYNNNILMQRITFDNIEIIISKCCDTFNLLFDNVLTIPNINVNMINLFKSSPIITKKGLEKTGSMLSYDRKYDKNINVSNIYSLLGIFSRYHLKYVKLLCNVKHVMMAEHSDITKDDLPPNLTSLQIQDKSHNFIIPDNLQRLDIYDTPSIILPPSLNELVIRNLQYSNLSLSNITRLFLYNAKVNIKVYPCNLKKIVIDNYNYLIDNLPDSVEYITLRSYTIKINKYPTNLKEIYYGRYDHDISILLNFQFLVLSKRMLPDSNLHSIR